MLDIGVYMVKNHSEFWGREDISFHLFTFFKHFILTKAAFIWSKKQ